MKSRFLFTNLINLVFHKAQENEFKIPDFFLLKNKLMLIILFSDHN